MNPKSRWQIKAAMHTQCIENHFISYAHTQAQWQAVLQNPTLFNRAWRHMLGIPPGDMPPEPFRRLPR